MVRCSRRGGSPRTRTCWLACRFPLHRVKEYEYELGQYAFAGQYQQSPVPRKGGIFKREYWQPYVPPTTGSNKGKWPDFDFIVVSVDSAFTEKEVRLRKKDTARRRIDSSCA
jgi:hypothetical protein